MPLQLEKGHLRALGIGVSSYTSGEHLTFFQSADDESGYTRTQRLAVPVQLRVEHLVASAAIPFVFPAQRIEHVEHAGWYGDGSMRQIAPISPAIHLGAQRVLIVGVGRMHEPARQVDRNGDYPSLAQIGGHALSSIFLDSLTVDIERMERINRTLALMSDDQRAASTLVPVQALVIAPSERIDEIAARHQTSLPKPVRALLRGVGASGAKGDVRGAAFASYLLFESSFTQELMALGEWDTLAKRSLIRSFFGWE
ncbi:Patatin [plant metagenome]|uniref:Patatin n=1 Tax=plant metagenome TaxID=1297885 RepID=A0A484VFZ1_9ZZZZ